MWGGGEILLFIQFIMCIHFYNQSSNFPPQRMHCHIYIQRALSLHSEQDRNLKTRQWSIFLNEVNFH